VSLPNLEPSAAGSQLDLFTPRRASRLGKTLDAITARFGKDAISRAVERPHKITHGRAKKRGE
jgi:hypothetical protein